MGKDIDGGELIVGARSLVDKQLELNPERLVLVGETGARWRELSPNLGKP
jgi:hypothetical protein